MRAFQRFIVLFLFILHVSYVGFSHLGFIKPNLWAWIVFVLGVSLTFSWLLFEWIHFKYLKDSETWKAHLESNRWKNYLKVLKKELLSDKEGPPK